MGDAALRGQVMMLLRKRKTRNFNTFYQRQQPPYQQNQVPYYNVIVNRHDNEGFGFVIISSSNQMTGGSTIGEYFGDNVIREGLIVCLVVCLFNRKIDSQ